MGNGANQRPIVNIVGERVALGPLRRDLIPTYQRWHNDVATTRTFALTQPTTLEEEEASYAALSTDEHMAFFTVYERTTWRAIGTAYLTDIDHRNRTAEFGILIGDAEHRGRGYGTEATRLVLGYAFADVGLHSVMLTVHEYNVAGRTAYEKAGFREFARRRQAHVMGGKPWDIVYMECLATEFAVTLLGPVSVPDGPAPRTPICGQAP